MRISLRLAIILVVFSGHAWAKDKVKKGAADAKSGPGTMNSNDPAEKETSDNGPFAPPHKNEAAENKGEGDKAEGDQAEGKEGADADKAKPDAPVAEQPDVIKRRHRQKVAVFGNLVIGFGKPTEPGLAPGADGDQTNKGTSFTFIAGGHYDVSPDFTLGLRIPWTTANMRQLDGSHASSQALGAPELMGEYRITLSPRTEVPIDFALGVPVAQGGYDQVTGTAAYRQALVNDFADAASGFRDGELFWAKRLPIVVGVGIDYQRKELSLHAETKFVAGVKVGGTARYQVDQFGTYELKSLTFRNVTSAGIGYQVLPKPALSLGLDSWLAINAVNAVVFHSNAGATAPSAVQVVAEPRVSARFGKISPSLGYIFPLGGRLADNHTSGLELHCDVAF